MASFTVVPTTPPTMLPFSPTDGQIFLDYDGVQWQYNSEMDLWLRHGAVESLPLATDATSGLLGPADKTMIDNIPATPGGFGIVTPNNPIGPMTGNLVLTSDSLDIRCIGNQQNCVDRHVAVCEGSLGPDPGISFALSENFIKGLVVHLPGQGGHTGAQGITGLQGPPGYSQGPKGDKGNTGDSSNVLCTLNSLIFEDLPGVTDSAIVDIRMTDNCDLIYTKAKINIPSGPAQKLSAAPITRSLAWDGVIQRGDCDIYKRLGDWTLYQPPNDPTPLDIRLVRLAKNTDNTGSAGSAFNTYPLTQFIMDVVGSYQATLEKLDTTWQKEVKTYIQGIDDKARSILSDLAGQLADCEFKSPTQICVMLNPLPSVATGVQGT